MTVMVRESTSVQPIGAGSILSLSGVPLYLAYHGQTVGRT